MRAQADAGAHAEAAAFRAGAGGFQSDARAHQSGLDQLAALAAQPSGLTSHPPGAYAQYPGPHESGAYRQSGPSQYAPNYAPLSHHQQPVRLSGQPPTMPAGRPPMHRMFRRDFNGGRSDVNGNRVPEQRPAASDNRSKQRRKRDCELMARVAIGDTDAFSEVWGYYRRWLAWHLYQRGIMDPDGVNDVLQEVCIKILRSAHKYDPHLATVGTWLLLLIENCVYVRRTKQRRLQSYRFIPIGEKYELTSEDQFDMDVSRSDSQALIRLALERLAPMLREVLDLRFFQGLEIEQIAVMQRVPEHTVRGRIERGVKELRWHFRDELKRLGAGVVRGRPAVPRLITRFVED